MHFNLLHIFLYRFGDFFTILLCFIVILIFKNMAIYLVCGGAVAVRVRNENGMGSFLSIM